jgi:hypothetical protein
MQSKFAILMNLFYNIIDDIGINAHFSGPFAELGPEF